jgi:hypothetical protein
VALVGVVSDTVRNSRDSKKSSADDNEGEEDEIPAL